MGNSGGKPTVVLETDGDTFYAGAKITGKVYLNVPTEGYSASFLKVGVYGKENTRVRYTTKRGDRRVTTHAHDSKDICSFEANLTQFPSKVVPVGQYEYPFEFDLPNNLPSQFYCADHTSRCSVEYQITVCLRREGIFESDVENRKKINIFTNPRTYDQESVRLPPNTQSVNFCCCINKGSITLKADADKNVFHRNEDIKVGYSINNKSTTEVENIRVFVEECVRWRAGSRSKTVTKLIAISSLRGYPSNPGIADGQAKTADLKIQAFARDSYDGGIIDIGHSLRVVADTPYCITNPEVSSPVYILPELADISEEATSLSPEFVTASSDPNLNVPSEPNDKKEAYNSVPPGWSPTVSSNVTVVASNVIISGQSGTESTGYQDPDASNENSLETLMSNLGRTFDYVGVTNNFLETSDGVVKGITPRDLVAISNKISFALDKLDVLKLITTAMEEKFKVVHLRALLDSTHNISLRLSLLKNLALMTSDFEENKGVIFKTLDSFEKEEFKGYIEPEGLTS